MPIKPDLPYLRRCPCGGANPDCPQCGGRGVFDSRAVRRIMSGPAGIRRRIPVPREVVGTVSGPPEPRRCPYCNFEVLNLPSHVAESHPEHLPEETEVERKAREEEEARQAAIAAEIARREAEAAQRKAEARARRQAVEGLPSLGTEPSILRSPTPSPVHHQHVPAASDEVAPPSPAIPAAPIEAILPHSHEENANAAKPARAADEVWARMQRALADRTVLTGTIRSRRPFGVFVDVGGIDGLVRNRELGRSAAGPEEGQAVQVVVIALREDVRQVELSIRQAEPKPPRQEREATRPAPRVPEGPMAMAFRLAQEKKQREE
jgi:predicted RNA-binding protein with RPS1 domain